VLESDLIPRYCKEFRKTCGGHVARCWTDLKGVTGCLPCFGREVAYTFAFPLGRYRASLSLISSILPNLQLCIHGRHPAFYKHSERQYSGNMPVDRVGCNETRTTMEVYVDMRLVSRCRRLTNPARKKCMCYNVWYPASTQSWTLYIPKLTVQAKAVHAACK
jgi:hypothetical protein